MLREDLALLKMELARVRVDWQRAESLQRHSFLALASAIGGANLSVKSLAPTPLRLDTSIPK